jgi:polysaccharide export outer membrane protein
MFMKNIFTILKTTTAFNLMIIALCLFSSCRSHKDLTILKDVSLQGGAMKGFPEPPQAYKIRKDDNLFVSIISSNAEMNELYNPALAGNGRTQTNTSGMYNEVAGQYIFGYLVDASGNITLPLIGKVNVIGLTLLEAETAITGKAKEYLKEFTVKVRLLTYRITVIGEVNKPGVYYNYNSYVTVMDAISMANGITNYADLEKVLVLRSTPTGSQSYYLKLSSKESLASAGYFLQPNDVLIIEPSRYKNVQLRSPIYSIVLSSVATVVLLVSVLVK